MSSSYFHKPENALQRAVELQAINQPDAALTILHEVLAARRHKTWSPVYEQVMILYVDLCLRGNKSREAKDGLHQYRNLSQSQAPGSLENVIRYLIEKAEEKCRIAKENSDSIQLAGYEEVQEEDQDQDAVDELTTHQSIMLSTMSTDPEKTQRETAVVLPSIKFLWEAYRAVLDILRSNSKLEHLYHSTALGALTFCRTYKRRTEFRRFCEMLRQHLANLQKYGSSQEMLESKPNNKVRGWEGWTSESIELHLNTRFQQLQTASSLHLYTEGFRTVEEIYNILQISHMQARRNPNASPPKAKLMATYYEKLTDLFWVSENYLFHSFAWYKYYTLCREYNKSMSDEQKSLMASTVLLAALCIPDTETSLGKQKENSSSNRKNNMSRTSQDETNEKKTTRMATLLGFHTTHPTRSALLEELSSRNILDEVPKYLRDLYKLLEESSDPLVMVATARPQLDRLKKETSVSSSSEEKKEESEESLHPLAQYVKPLTNVLLQKLLFNLSAAYHTVSLKHLRTLTDELGLTFEDVEKAIVLSTQYNKSFSVRIDHREKCLRFGGSDLESEEMRGQLITLSRQLLQVSKHIDSTTDVSPEDKKSRLAESEKSKQLYDFIRENIVSEHKGVLDRKNEIEKRKEEVERLAQEKIREEMRLKAEKEAANKAEEQRRLAREQKLREKEKIQKVQKEMEQLEKKKYLTAMGKNTEDMNEKELEAVDTAKLMKEHAAAAMKKKEAAERKLREAAKKLDYTVRAIRIEELPLIKKQYEEKVSSDKERYEKDIVEKRAKAKAQWEKDEQEKKRLEEFSIFNYGAEFEKISMSRRKKIHKGLCEEADKEAEKEAEERKRERAFKRKNDEAKAKAEEEARLKAEEEKRKIEEEKARREEERKAKAAEDEKRRQAEASRLEEERRKRESSTSAKSRGLGDAFSARRGGGTGDRGGYGGGRYDSGRDRGGGYGGGRYNSGGGGGNRGGGYGGGRYDGGNRGRDEGGSSSGGGSRGLGQAFSGRRSGGDRDGDRDGGYGGGRYSSGGGDGNRGSERSGGGRRWG